MEQYKRRQMLLDELARRNHEDGLRLDAELAAIASSMKSTTVFPAPRTFDHETPERKNLFFWKQIKNGSWLERVMFILLDILIVAAVAFVGYVLVCAFLLWLFFCVMVPFGMLLVFCIR